MNQTFRPEDEKHIRECFELAKSVKGRTRPDPLVGAVVVKDGEVISRGYHAELGTPHAEAYALQKAGDNAKGGTIYVNLEPCTHWGNNPPCTDFIIKAGIKRVVYSVDDPNPLVKAKASKAILNNEGIEVISGVLEEEGKKLNEAYIRFITKKKPFVYYKTAMSLDGKIATFTGESKWITNLESSQYTHRLRREVDAVVVGINTVLKDNPRLTVRDQGAIKSPIVIDPVRIVLDSKGRIPLSAKVFNPDSSAGELICVTNKAPKKKISALNKKTEVLVVKTNKQGLCDWNDLLKKLGQKNFTSILIEGGGSVGASAFEAGIIDKVYFFIAPKLIGGKTTPTPIDGVGIKRIKDIVNLKEIEFTQLGDNILVSGYIR